MALKSWLIKVKRSLINELDPTRFPLPTFRKSPIVGVLAFEIVSLMSKLLHLWNSLFDAHVSRLRHESISLDSIHKFVSNNDSFLLSIACTELIDSLRIVVDFVSQFYHRYTDPSLLDFQRLFLEFVNREHDPNSCVLSWKDMEAQNKKMDQLFLLTATLCKETEEMLAMDEIEWSI